MTDVTRNQLIKAAKEVFEPLANEMIKAGERGGDLLGSDWLTPNQVVKNISWHLDSLDDGNQWPQSSKKAMQVKITELLGIQWHETIKGA